MLANHVLLHFPEEHEVLVVIGEDSLPAPHLRDVEGRPCGRVAVGSPLPLMTS
jgi:hypothetical protein